MTVLGAIPDVIDGHQSLTTLFGLLEADAELPYSGRGAIEFSGRIRAENLSFAYGESPVLRDVSLRIEPAHNVCVTGANGTGKSTLLMLLLGFYRPDRGCLYADGVPYDDLDVAALRRSIGTVTQTPLLFTGSVRDNIAYGSPGASDADVEEAAKAALAHDFITELPEGYRTEVGDEAQRLSGGQRQRLSIARALLRRPKLLVLDEPTTYLDRETVSRLIESMAALPYAPAILTVTHDLQLLRDTDEAYHLEAGVLQRLDPSETRVA
jgi:ATP-binding cassette subfamily B protein